MTETLAEVWKKELAEQPLVTAPAVPMTFAGLPCMVRPLSLDFYIRSGRMPEYLARIAMHGGDKAVTQAVVSQVTPEEVLEGQKFQRAAVCRVMVEPRIVEAPEGGAPEGGFTYMEIAEKRKELVEEVFVWILRGCPVEPEGAEGAGLDAPALENFPEGKRRAKRPRPRRDGKANRENSVAASTGKSDGV